MDNERIAICDDQQDMVFLLGKQIKRILKEMDVAWTVDSFTSGEKLLEKIEQYPIVFLDIEMPGMDGIDTGREALKRNPECKLIMATGAVERFKEAFQIQAFRFITKPYEPGEIKEALEAVFKVAVGGDTIELYSNRCPYNIAQKDIAYIRAYNGYSEFVVNDNLFRREESLDEVEQMLDDRLFVRIHRQFIINMAFIDSYKNGEIQIGEEVFTVSRRNKKEFERIFTEYNLKHK